jgi:hypothetical protein
MQFDPEPTGELQALDDRCEPRRNRQHDERKGDSVDSEIRPQDMDRRETAWYHGNGNPRD